MTHLRTTAHTTNATPDVPNRTPPRRTNPATRPRFPVLRLLLLRRLSLTRFTTSRRIIRGALDPTRCRPRLPGPPPTRPTFPCGTLPPAAVAWRTYRCLFGLTNLWPLAPCRTTLSLQDRREGNSIGPRSPSPTLERSALYSWLLRTRRRTLPCTLALGLVWRRPTLPPTWLAGGRVPLRGRLYPLVPHPLSPPLKVIGMARSRYVHARVATLSLRRST